MPLDLNDIIEGNMSALIDEYANNFEASRLEIFFIF